MYGSPGNFVWDRKALLATFYLGKEHILGLKVIPVPKGSEGGM